MRIVDEFVLVMMKVSMGLFVKYFEFRFKISASAVSKYLILGQFFMMCKCMRSLIVFPELEVLQVCVTDCFENFF